MLLKGVIDCPDLPLNVSRSALQNDGFVKKISEYISKKFADKLSGMCKTDRENYEKYWDDINPFIKIRMHQDEKFSKKMMDYILFKNIDGKYLTLEDCINENKKEEVLQRTLRRRLKLRRIPKIRKTLTRRKSRKKRLFTTSPTKFSRASTSTCSAARWMRPPAKHNIDGFHYLRALQRACNLPAHRCRSDQRYERRVR